MADDRTSNGTAQWFNHDEDPEEYRIKQWMDLQNVSCNTLGGHAHRLALSGEKEVRHHHHDEKCIFQAGVNSMMPGLQVLRREIETMNDAMDQIHRIAKHHGSPKGKEYCRDRY